MMKVTKSAIVCDKCGSELKSQQYDTFCDVCKMKIETNDNLILTIFWKDGSNEQVDFCSLKCMKQWLLCIPINKKEIDFIALPYIHNVDDLKEILKEEN